MAKKSSSYQQQGDVLIKPVAGIPGGAKQLDHNRVAEGEATGHCHTIEGEGVVLYEHGGVIYASVPKGGVIKHQEHAAQRLAPGEYQFPIVREWNHFEQEAQKVLD